MNGIQIVHAFVEGEERELIEELKARITDLEQYQYLLAECERERDNAWDKYAEVCQEKADLERELHEARESFADYAEEMGQRLAQAEKVVEAAKELYDDYCREYPERQRELRDAVFAALEEGDDAG